MLLSQVHERLHYDLNGGNKMRTEVINNMTGQQDISDLHTKILNIINEMIENEGLDENILFTTIVYTDYVIYFEMKDNVSVIYIGIITVNKNKIYLEYGEWKNIIRYDIEGNKI